MSKTLQAESLQAESLQAEASVKDKILNGINAYTPLLRENFKSTFVTLQSGKSLSTNDFTNAYKTKLDSIQSGAQVNIIENISVNGVNASIDNKTANITLSADNSFVINNHTVKSASIEGADVTFTSDTAKISITGGEGANFTVNGAEVTAMSVVGAASVSTASDTAIVSITGGGSQVQNITLNGAEVNNITISGANVSIDNKLAKVTIPSSTINGNESNIVSISGGATVTYNSSTKVTNIFVASKATLQNPNFIVTPANVTLNAYEPVTITAATASDGIVSCFNSRFAEIEQLNKREFRVAPKYSGSGDIGFWVGETADFYGASQNVNIYCPEPSGVAVLMHFDDAEEPFLNEGTAAITGATLNGSSIESGGKFGSCLKANDNDSAIIIPAQAIGGKDFTIEFWNKTEIFFSLFTDITNNKRIQLTNNNGYYNVAWNAGYVAGVNANANNLKWITPKYITNDWAHIAFCYDHANRQGYAFINGENVDNGDYLMSCNITRRNIARILLGGYLDELRILDGVCRWKENFTPPTQPY